MHKGRSSSMARLSPGVPRNAMIPFKNENLPVLSIHGTGYQAKCNMWQGQRHQQCGFDEFEHIDAWLQ